MKSHTDSHIAWHENPGHVNRSPGELNSVDVYCEFNFTDDNGDNVRDNIVGHNYTPGFKCTVSETDTCPSCFVAGHEDSMAFWSGIPQDWILENNLIDRTILSWKTVDYVDHGTRVASIAAAGSSGANIVGVAPNCQVYFLRETYGPTTGNAKMILHAASVCDVINMSWWPSHGLMDT